MKITLERNKVTKTVKTGFSFWYFILGPWLPMFKGQMGKSFKHSIYFICTLSIYYWIQAFGGWNKSKLQALLDQGWKPLTDNDVRAVNNIFN